MLVRILVVDDHTLFRRGLIALLSREAHLNVVAEAADAGEALRQAQATQPDVILLDNHLPGVHGIDALPQLHEVAPRARIVMLTVSEDASDMAQALARGAAGYLLKTIEGDALSQAIDRVLAGESVVSPEMTGKLVAAYRSAVAQPQPDERPDAAHAMAPTTSASTAPPPLISEYPASAALGTLSPRELDILREIARGASNKDIARTLGIAETTVKIHVQHILRKLGLTSRVQAAVLATSHLAH